MNVSLHFNFEDYSEEDDKKNKVCEGADKKKFYILDRIIIDKTISISYIIFIVKMVFLPYQLKPRLNKKVRNCMSHWKDVQLSYKIKSIR